MNTSVLHGGRRWLAVLACLASLIAAPAYAQNCGNPNQRGAKIQGEAVLDNVFDFNEISTGVFDPNKLTIRANPSSRPTLGPGVTYSWSQGAGQTPGNFSTTSGMETLFTVPDVAPSGEAITVTLTVHSVASGCPGTWTATLTLNVVDKDDVVVNAKPVASAVATPALVDEGVPVTLDGTASYDPEGLALGYQWTQVSGTPVVLSGADTDTASFEAPNTAYPAGDTLEFSLRVSDGVYEDVKNVTVNVTWVNDPPITLLSCPLAVNERSAVVLDGSQSSDSDDGIASYAWTGGWPDVDLSAFNTQAITVTAPTLGYQDAGFYTFQLTATDEYGAYTFDDCTVQVRDVTPPRLDLPQDIEQEAESATGNTVFYAASAFDAVDGTVPEAHFSCAPPSGSTFALGTAPAKSHTTTVNCQTTDSAGNTATGSFNVTIRDTMPPVITAPLSLSAEATGPNGAMVEFSATTYDVVDGSGTATCSQASGSVFPLGDTSVTCNAVDQRGNAAIPATFVVRVVDTTPPVISEHADVGPVEATSPSGAAVSFSLPTAADLVDGPVGVSCLPASGSTFAIGTHGVTCTANDGRGNTASRTFNVTVQDTTPPTISEHADVGPIEATGPAGAAVSFSLPTAVDLVDGPVGVACLPASGSTFAIGTHAVTCTASDSRGNNASSTFNVTVQDKTPPTLYYTGDVTVVVEGGNNSAVVNYDKPTAWDLVDGWNTTVTCTPESGQSFPVGSNTVECTASDSRGNTATGSFQVHVQYPWSGFLQPVDNPNALNTAKAGSAIPVKFSLGGYYGMNIFDNGPASGTIGCTETSGTAIDQTVTAGSSSLQYDAGTKQYIYVWKTEKSWVGQCRILQFKLQDDTVRYALFKFK